MLHVGRCDMIPSVDVINVMLTLTLTLTLMLKLCCVLCLRSRPGVWALHRMRLQVVSYPTDNGIIHSCCNHWGQVYYDDNASIWYGGQRLAMLLIYANGI